MKTDKISEKALAKIMEKNRRHLNKQIAAYEQIAEIRIHATEFEKTAKIMTDIHTQCVKYGTTPDGYINYVKGANVAGFLKVARAMLSQGVI